MTNLFVLRLLTFTAFLLSTSLNAQHSVVHEKVDSVYIQNVLDSVVYYLSKDLPKAEILARSALKLSKESSLYSLRAKSYANVARVFYTRGPRHYAKAMNYLDSAIFDFRQLGDSANVYLFLVAKADLHYSNNETNDAMKIIYKALGAMAHEKKPNLGVAYNSLGMIYGKLELYDSAISCYKRALLYYKENMAMSNMIHLNLSTEYKFLGEMEQAYVYGKKAYDGLKNGKNRRAFAMSSFNLGLLVLDNGDLTSAKKYITEALSVARKIGYAEVHCRSLVGMGKLFIKLEQTDSSIYFLNRAEHLTDSLGFEDIYLSALETKAKLYEQIGDVHQSLFYHKLYTNLKDSFMARKDFEGVVHTILDKENQEHQKKLFDYQLILQNRNLQLLFLVLLASAIIGLGAFLVRRYWGKWSVITREKESLKSEKAYINRKLVSTTANLARQRELLIETAAALRNIKSRYDYVELHEEIKKTQAYIKEQLEIEELWEEFFLHFNEVHPNFLHTLKQNYGLTQNDLKLCTFVKMKLSNKEMSRILKVNYNSIRTILHRLKKKLNVPENMSLSDFLIAHEDNRAN